MWNFFNTTSEVKKANYEDITVIISSKGVIINTLPITEQDCLIAGTMNIQHEERIINQFLSTNCSVKIIIYGKNANDDAIYTKHKQLVDLGFKNVYIYLGGLFEWLLLQDIYGNDEFKTTKKELDILKYKPKSILSNALVIY